MKVKMTIVQLFLLAFLLTNVSHVDSSGRQEMMCSVSGLVLEILLGTNEQQITKEVTK